MPVVQNLAIKGRYSGKPGRENMLNQDPHTAIVLHVIAKKHDVSEIDNERFLENELHFLLFMLSNFPPGVASDPHGRFCWLIAQPKTPTHPMTGIP